ncbi:MAG TPA: glycosyltransferase family 39 protein [Candidatus Binataceae bacterium]|nr:glycosyltransferase family 39 protein [Candidatus Binataceae bacterium]HVC43844.1 glycosyltransferase family 39 protein [Candidatus Binataceae bacterium]
MKSQPPRTLLALGAIVIAATVLLTNRLGASDICGGDEAVEAVFVQQMVEHGHLLFPLENGAQPMYKPPLFHWTAFAIDRLTGQRRVTAANLRAAAAFYALAGVIMTIAFALWLLGAEGAILAGLALAGSYQYINQGRFGRVDMTLCFFEAAALFTFVRWLPEKRDALIDAPAHRMLLYLLALTIGLGVLAKGPIGALLPGAAIVAFMASERRWRQLLAMLEPGPLIVGAAIASSWYAACYLGGRFGFLNRQLGSENFGRFFGSLGAMAPWYYLKPLFLNSAPQSLLVPIAVALALWPHAETGAESSSGDDALLRVRSAMRLLAIFWIVTVVFFNLAAYKRRSYLLPLWPPAAVMLAWLVMSVRDPRWARAARLGFGAACAILIVFNLIYIPHQEARDCAGSSYRPAAREINRAVAPSDPLYTFGFHEELAPLLFYLDRDAPVLKGRLGNAPPGYVIVPARVWRARRGEALDLTPVLTSNHGTRHLILLRRGKTYARR